MEYLVYLCCRVIIGLIVRLPIRVIFRLGQFFGGLGYGLLWPYRRLVLHNLTIAYGAEKSRKEIRALGRAHFVRLGANLLSSIKTPRLTTDELREIVTIENLGILEHALREGKGVVLVISHSGNWELFTQICTFLPGYRWGAVYQSIRNPYIERYVRRLRMARGMELFNRRDGYGAPMAFLRAGGAVGILADQYAGEGGVWTPFFGRLASTSPLAALCASRTGAALVPMTVQTGGAGRWKAVISPPIPRPPEAASEASVRGQTVRINQVIEAQVRAAPADWLWAHGRWKTPTPNFLHIGQRRGIALPTGWQVSELKPFRILVRSTNHPGDLALTIPVVETMAGKRPDARVCVLTPARCAEAWRGVRGVAEVVPIAPGQGLFEVVAAIRRVGGFDAGIVLPNSLRSALEMFLAGVPLRVGYAGRWRRLLLNQLIDDPPGGQGVAAHSRRIQQTLRYTRIARKIGALAPERGALPQKEVSLTTAVQRGWVRAQFRGDGRVGITAEYVSCHDGPLRVWVASGTRFESADQQSQMAIARGGAVELAPSQKVAVPYSAVVTISTSRPSEQDYLLHGDTLPKLTALLEQAESSRGLSHAAVQSAVLMLTENAPLSLFARFPLSGGDPAARTEPTAFQVDTLEILAAFGLLKKTGHRKADFAAMQNSQFKIEAMIDPRSHAAAQRYYHLVGAGEWNYWCRELEWGKRRTRHYALCGIGRYYPEAALQMMPGWARAPHLNTLYRVSAIQALAETRRPEVIPILREMLREFGGATELRESVHRAIAHLESLGIPTRENGVSAEQVPLPVHEAHDHDTAAVHPAAADTGLPRVNPIDI